MEIEIRGNGWGAILYNVRQKSHWRTWRFTWWMPYGGSAKFVHLGPLSVWRRVSCVELA